MIYNFEQGLPDPELFPVDLLAAHIAAVLHDDGADALAYYGDGGPSEMRYGHLGLRAALAERLSRRDGRPIGPENILLANGSTDGLAMAVRTHLGAGDGAVVESATYHHTRRFMLATGATVVGSRLDEHGLDIDALRLTFDTLAASGHQPTMLYTIPTFHAPTGSVLPPDRRRALVSLAAERGVLVLEDNCYHELGYDAPPPPTLLALDGGDVVLQSDSFSKYVAPGLRLAWLAGPVPLVDAIADDRQDFAVSRLLAGAVERYVRAGDHDRHLALLRDRYRHKRDLTAAALSEHAAPWARAARPAGGLYFWVELDEAVDVDRAHRLLTERGVGFRSGTWFTGDDSGRRFVRLSPIQVPVDEIEAGIALFGAALSDSVR